MCVTHVLFSSFAFLPSFASFSVSHLGFEAGDVVEAVFGVPLLSTLFASKAKLLVLVLPLIIQGAIIRRRKTNNILTIGQILFISTNTVKQLFFAFITWNFTPSCSLLSSKPERLSQEFSCLLPGSPVCLTFLWENAVSHDPEPKLKFFFFIIKWWNSKYRTV